MKKFEFLIIIFGVLFFCVSMNSYAQWGEREHAYQVVLDGEGGNFIPSTVILKDQYWRVQDIGETSYNGIYYSHYNTDNLMAAHYNYLVGTEGERLGEEWTFIHLTQSEPSEPKPRRPVELLAPEE